MPIKPDIYRDSAGRITRDYTRRNAGLRQTASAAWEAAAIAIEAVQVPVELSTRAVAYVDIAPCSFTRLCAKHAKNTHPDVFPGMLGEDIASPNGQPVFGRRFAITKAYKHSVSAEAAYAGALAFARSVESALEGVAPRVTVTWEKLQ
jgi:hypothetical protein